MKFIIPTPLPPLLNFGGAAHSTTFFKECIYVQRISEFDG